MFTIYSSDVIGNPGNCSYPHKHVILDEDSLKAAISHDYVCAEYKNNYRNGNNFIGSDCLPVDCDNDHSENPEDWITPEDIMKAFPGVTFAVHYSRYNNKVKNGKPARPKFHILFPIEYVTDATLYSDMKKTVNSIFPYFDTQALDAARFFFGTATADVVLYPGCMNLTEYLNEDVFDEDMSQGQYGDVSIPEGSRNATMSHFAGRVIKKYGDCDKAYQAFMEESAKCTPPLSSAELTAIWHSAQRFYARVQKQDGYVAPEIYNDTSCYKPEDYSDIGEAKVLTREYGDELKYTAATDYIRYDGKVWVENKQMAVGACVEFLDLQLQDALNSIEKAGKALVKAGYDASTVNKGSKAVAKEIKPEHLNIFYMLLGAEKYLAFTMKHRDYRYITSTLNVAKPMVAVNVSDLDKDPVLLNTPKATYNLEKGMAGEQPHNPLDLITKITECSPGDEGMDIWLEALDTFFCGDIELIEYVQEVIGLAVIGKVYEEFIIIAYGDGANGKSTFWNTIARVLGTYSGKISSDILTVGNKINAQPEMAELKGKRLIIASEMQEGVRLNTAMVKQLCSTDEIQACKKYKDPFHFVPSHQVVLYTNHLPRVGANDDGIWRRLKVIPFNAKIKGKSDIKNYADYLYDNAAPSIMKWIIEGAEKVSSADYKVNDPKCVTDAVAAYRDDNDWFGHFIDDCCEVDNSYEEKSGEFYQQYRAYCIQSGEHIRSTTDFYAAVEKMGFYRHKTNKGSFVKGVKLKTGNDFI